MIRYSDFVGSLFSGKYYAGNSAWGMAKRLHTHVEEYPCYWGKINSAGDILQSTGRINVGDESNETASLGEEIGKYRPVGDRQSLDQLGNRRHYPQTSLQGNIALIASKLAWGKNIC